MNGKIGVTDEGKNEQETGRVNCQRETPCYKPETLFMATVCNTLIYTLKQDGWDRGKPNMINDIEIRIFGRGHNNDTIAEISNCIVVALNGKLVNNGGLLTPISPARQGKRKEMETIKEDEQTTSTDTRSGSGVFDGYIAEVAMETEIEKVKRLLEEAYNHLEFCGWGDSWERGCSEELREELDEYFGEEI